jgi:hypothetical protein
MALLGLFYFYNKSNDAKRTSLVSITQTNKLPPTTSPVKPILKTVKIEAAKGIKLKEKIELALKQLPSPKDISKLTSREVHHTPKVISSIGQILGEIKEIYIQHPHLRPQALEFYKKCATDSKAMNSVKTLCLINIVKISNDLDMDIDHDRYSFESFRLIEKVLKLQKKL